MTCGPAHHIHTVRAGIATRARPGVTGITVNAPGATVVPRGLSINGQGGGPGVDVQAASRVRIESCVASYLTGDGIDDSATGAEMIVLDTIVRDNTGQGIQLHADGSAVLDHARSEHNGIQGFAVEPASSEASATVSDSVFSYNGANGVIATSGPGTRAFVQVERSVMSNNGSSGFFAFTSSSGGTTTAMLSRNAINRNTANGVLLSAPSVGFDGYTIVSLSENAINANQTGLHLLGAHSTAFTSLNTANSNPTNDVDCDVDGRVASTHNNGVSSALKGSCIAAYSSW